MGRVLLVVGCCCRFEGMQLLLLGVLSVDTVLFMGTMDTYIHSA